MKITLFWDVKIEAICSTNIWLNFYYTTWGHNPEDGYLHRCIKFWTLHSSTEESTTTLIFMTDTVIELKLLVLMYQKMKTMTKNNSWSMKAYTNTIWDSEVQLNTRCWYESVIQMMCHQTVIADAIFLSAWCVSMMRCVVHRIKWCNRQTSPQLYHTLETCRKRWQPIQSSHNHLALGAGLTAKCQPDGCPISW